LIVAGRRANVRGSIETNDSRKSFSRSRTPRLLNGLDYAEVVPVTFKYGTKIIKRVTRSDIHSGYSEWINRFCQWAMDNGRSSFVTTFGNQIQHTMGIATPRKCEVLANLAKAILNFELGSFQFGSRASYRQPGKIQVVAKMRSNRDVVHGHFTALAPTKHPLAR
jgi:hypothetical protein